MFNNTWLFSKKDVGEGLWMVEIFYGKSSSNSEKEHCEKETCNCRKKECSIKKGRCGSYEIQVQDLRICVFTASRGAA